jgi:anti-sigma regulatory factor (Ser/Thr protein kinase)
MTNQRKESIEDARQWITKAVVDYPERLGNAICEKFDVTRATSSTWLRRLADEGYIERHGTTRPYYTPGPKKLIFCSYRLPGLDESMVWLKDIEPYLVLSPNIMDIVHHGITEMVNNANDHSSGTKVRVIVEQDADVIRGVVADNGVGIFEKITTSLSLPDRRLALLELSKGKLTTDSSRHTGEGIFFTSRAFDKFLIQANDLSYTHDSDFRYDWLLEQDVAKKGTAVHMKISLKSETTLAKIFAEYSSGPEAFDFSKTVVPVRLARLGNENLISRSQAKRLIQRFEQFRSVILDFDEVPSIGQAFADELFRVFAGSHPEVKLVPAHANTDVQQMIIRVTNQANGNQQSKI